MLELYDINDLAFGGKTNPSFKTVVVKSFVYGTYDLALFHAVLDDDKVSIAVTIIQNALFLPFLFFNTT